MSHLSAVDASKVYCRKSEGHIIVWLQYCSDDDALLSILNSLLIDVIASLSFKFAIFNFS